MEPEDPSIEPDASRFVSTGQLPPRDRVQLCLDEAYERFGTVDDGEVSSTYPALAQVDPSLFGICIADTSGTIHAVGDADAEFTIMSASKPFVLGIVAERLGSKRTHQLLGANGTGLPFNSLEAVERSEDGRTNPMVNPGAIATTSHVPGETVEAAWSCLRHELSRFAGRELELDEDVYRSATATNVRNRELAALLHARGRLARDPVDALELYTRQCALRVSSRDLALMGATLADGGVHPVTREAVVGERTARDVLAVMTTAGLYETSGDWLWDVGLPGKSGIGGGIVTIAPGKGGLGTFSPRLDAAGNSVRGQLVAALLARSLGLDLFASAPVS
jgi:glutaminase